MSSEAHQKYRLLNRAGERHQNVTTVPVVRCPEGKRNRGQCRLPGMGANIDGRYDGPAFRKKGSGNGTLAGDGCSFDQSGKILARQTADSIVVRRAVEYCASSD